MTLSAGCYALGYLTGQAAFAWMARRRRLATTGIMTLLGAGLLGGRVGANLAQWVFGGTESGQRVALLGQAALGDTLLGRGLCRAELGAFDPPPSATVLITESMDGYNHCGHSQVSRQKQRGSANEFRLCP